MKVVVVDVDNVMADLSHRAHLVKGQSRDWTKFYAELPNDKPVGLANFMFNMMRRHGHSIVIVTGRDERFRKETKEWLDKNNFKYDELIMRPEGSRIPNGRMKVSEFYKWMKRQEQVDVVAVFDSFDDAIDEYRELLGEGVHYYQNT